MENFYFILELFTALPVYTFRLEKREKFWCRLLIVPAVLCGSTALFCGLGKGRTPAFWELKDSGEILLSGTVMVCLALVFMLAAVAWLLFRVPFREAVYCAACAYLTEHIAYCIRILVNEITASRLADSGSFFYYLIHVTVYILCYFVFARRMARRNHYESSAVQSLGLMVAALFVVLGMSIVATAYGFEQIHAVYALFSCIFVLYSQVKQQTQLWMQEELNLQQQLWMRHKAQYEMSKETIDVINRKCHDLKHQIAALNTIESSVERAEVIEEIKDSVMIYDSMLKTGNGILDTLLTEKSLLCNEKKISMTCIANGQLLDFMAAVDLYTLFGNALDNAIEAVADLPEEERFLSLLVHEKAGLVFVQVENRYRGALILENGIPKTTKADKNYHGFGIGSILRIAEKYHGFATIETEFGIFLLRLTFPAAGRSASGKVTGYDAKRSG